MDEELPPDFAILILVGGESQSESGLGSAGLGTRVKIFTRAGFTRSIFGTKGSFNCSESFDSLLRMRDGTACFDCFAPAILLTYVYASGVCAEFFGRARQG